MNVVIDRINQAAENFNSNGDKPYKIGFSIGKAMFDPLSNESIRGLLSRADAAMYQIKKERRITSAPYDNIPSGLP